MRSLTVLSALKKILPEIHFGRIFLQVIVAIEARTNILYYWFFFIACGEPKSIQKMIKIPTFDPILPDAKLDNYFPDFLAREMQCVSLWSFYFEFVGKIFLAQLFALNSWYILEFHR
jgi:hypothetical protein